MFEVRVNNTSNGSCTLEHLHIVSSPAVYNMINDACQSTQDDNGTGFLLTKAAMVEETTKPDQLIQVSDTQLTVGDQTYDLAGITSVRIREVTDKARWRRWVWISAVVLLAWSVMFAVWIYPMGDVRLVFLAVVPLAWLFITMRWGQTIDYILTLDTLFGPVDVASSKDKGYIRKLFNAIDPAIRERNWP